MGKFKVGDIVKISPESEFYNSNRSSNPKNMHGKIILLSDIDPNFSIRVKWDNSKYNVYAEYDLELIDLSIFEKLGD